MLSQLGDAFPLTVTITIGAAAVVAILGLVLKYLLDRRKREGGDKDAH